VIGCIVVLFAWLNSGTNASGDLQTVINFFMSVPISMVSSFDAPAPVIVLISFIYWMALGGIFGCVSSVKRPLSIVIVLILVACFIYLHVTLQAKLEGDIASSVNAFGKALAGAFRK